VGTINPDWYAGNATRAYPLDDAATARDDSNQELPSQILVDCRVRFPIALGQFAYVGGVTVSTSIVTVILMAAPNACRPPSGATPGNTDLQPLGAVTLPRPVVPNRHYPITPMAAGVGGWLVFGRGIEDNYSGRFSSPAQSLLLPRVASAYQPLPIPSLGKLGLDPGLTGVVQLLGNTDLEVVQDTREIDGAIVDAIIFRLVDSLNRNVYSFYAGPCAGRPESGTCATPVLEAINSAVPDCNGNLTIDFRNVNVFPFVDGGGLALDLGLGMADVCLGQDYLPDNTGKLPSEYENLCPPPEVPVIPPIEPTPPEPPSQEGCVALPYYESFDGVIPLPWTVVNGNFDIENDDSPGEPYGLEDSSGNTPAAGHTPGLTGLPPLQRATRNKPTPGATPIDRSYSAIAQSQRNASIWNCDYDSTLDLTCTTHLKLMPGPQVNGGIIWDYKAADPEFDNRPTYNLVAVDLAVNALAIWIYRGYSIQRSMWVPFNDANGTNMPVIGDWYELTVRTRLNADHPVNPVMWKIGITFKGVTNPAYPQKVWDQPWDLVPVGRIGLGTVNAWCRFSFFNLEPTPTGGPP
jgi:hypothetical protein